MKRRIKCIDCANWTWEAEIRGYSEWTPGDAWSWQCDYGHWRFGGSDAEFEIRQQLNDWRECSDYEKAH